MSASGPTPTGGPDATTAAVNFLRSAAPWLWDDQLATCIVGSQALEIACAAAGVPGPAPADLDLAWGPDSAGGRALLEQHGVFLPTTEGNVARGTLAMKVGGRRIEITTFRSGAPQAPVAQRIAADLGERDMTIGAVAFELATGTVHDPHGGLQHWREHRIVAVGDPAARVQEHAIRWLRYYRKAHQLGFSLDRRIRKLALDPGILLELPREAVALELRAILLQCASPGRCLLELHEDGLLDALSPELTRQFDGRPAGPQRHHPEVSQALHLVLALEWAVAHTQTLDERDRLAVRLAVLCHDLGKGYSRDAELPAHHGHEQTGLVHVDSLLDRWPGLADPRAHLLARHVCALHQEVRRFGEQRPGTLAGLYDDWFRPKDYPVDLFALAVAADSAGRLGLGGVGDEIASRVAADLRWLRSVCAAVDAGELRKAAGDDLQAFRAALHEARARAIAAAQAARLTSRPDVPRP